MSYCRIDNDSDIYAYRTVDSYTVNVARSVEMGWGKSVAIGLPHDGATFSEPTLEAFEKRLTDLRDMGYRVPDRAFNRIRRELNEQGPPKEDTDE